MKQIAALAAADVAVAVAIHLARLVTSGPFCRSSSFRSRNLCVQVNFGSY